jgi:hypothetical protein
MEYATQYVHVTVACLCGRTATVSGVDRVNADGKLGARGWIPVAPATDVFPAIMACSLECFLAKCGTCGHDRRLHFHGRCVHGLQQCDCVGFVRTAPKAPVPTRVCTCGHGASKHLFGRSTCDACPEGAKCSTFVAASGDKAAVGAALASCWKDRKPRVGDYVCLLREDRTINVRNGGLIVDIDGDFLQLVTRDGRIVQANMHSYPPADVEPDAQYIRVFNREMVRRALQAPPKEVLEFGQRKGAAWEQWREWVLRVAEVWTATAFPQRLVRFGPRVIAVHTAYFDRPVTVDGSE